MKRRKFIQLNTLVGSGLFFNVPLSAHYEPVATHWFWKELFKAVFKELAVYAVVEIGKAVLNPIYEDFKNSPVYQPTRSYLRQRNYAPIPNLPAWGYNLDNPVTTQNQFDNQPTIKNSSGFNGMMAFTLAQFSEVNHNPIRTQTPFILSQQERAGVATMLTEGHLVSLMAISKRLSPYYSVSEIQSAILPDFKRGSNEVDLSDREFNATSFKTKNGKVIIEVSTIRGNGKNTFPTNIESTISLIPNSTVKGSRNLLERTYRESFKIDLQEVIDG